MRARGHRISVAVAAGSLTASVLLTGCGGSSSVKTGGGRGPTAESADPQGQETPAEKTDAPEEKSRPLPTQTSQAEVELRKVLLTQGDLAEFRFVDISVTERTGLAAAAPVSCQPIEDVRLLMLDPKPKAFAARMAKGTSGDAAGTITTVALASYDQAGAKRIMAGLRAAVADCEAGYRAGVLPFTAVSKEKPLGVADEEVSYELIEQATQPGSYTVIRVGATVALFNTTAKTGTGGAVPSPLVFQQYMKIQAALARFPRSSA